MNPRVLLGAAAGISVVAVVAVAVALLMSGGDSDEPSESAEEVTQKVMDAMDEPGMVYHTVADDGAEVWLDIANQQFRRRDSLQSGQTVSVGQGWQRYSFDLFNNEVRTENLTPSGDAVARINNPATRWMDALAALAFGNTVTVVGATASDGRTVVAIDVESPVVSGETVTGSLFGRIELDPATYFPYSFETRQVNADGTTPTPSVVGIPVNRRIVYTTAELVPRDSLPDDFFDPQVVEEQVLTIEDNLAAIRAEGLTPLWLDHTFNNELGILTLPEKDNIFVVSSETSAEIHYSYVVPASPTTAAQLTDAVVIRLAADAMTFEPPSIPEFAPPLPEGNTEVTVRGQPATLYTSILSPADLPCSEPSGCPRTDVVLYRRLIFMVGDTAVQIETSARVNNDGNEINKFNTRDGIIRLAEALTKAPEGSNG